MYREAELDWGGSALDWDRRGGGQLRRRALQKWMKALLYPFAVLLTGTLGRLYREFCNSLRRRWPPPFWRAARRRRAARPYRQYLQIPFNSDWYKIDPVGERL